MMITDIEGNYIEVTDLCSSIQQAGEFLHYRHTDTDFADFDQRQSAYWSDIYSKLTACQTTKL